MEVEKLITKSPFKDLFPVDPKIVDALAEDMARNLYDGAHPIIIWRDLNIVIDGHCRLEAAKRNNIKWVPAIAYQFRDEAHALEYAIHHQRNRRNLTDAEILRCIKIMDKVQETKRDENGKFTGASSDAPGKSAAQTAKIVGTSQAKVERARTVMSDPEAETAVLSGEKSIHQATQEVKAKRGKTAKPKDETRPGERYARSVINKLSQIPLDDPERETALIQVRDWINGQLAEDL